MNEFNTPPIRVPAIPPIIGGKLKDLATVVPNAASVAGVPRLDKTAFDCDGFASTNMTFGE